MKNKVSYVVMSVLFFNLFFVFNYYFKIIDFLYIDFLFENRLIQIIFVNSVLVFMDAIFIALYDKLKIYKLSYFLVVILGFFIGLCISLIIFEAKYNLSNYLAVISYFIINTLFISYSLYFEKYKNHVFD